MQSRKMLTVGRDLRVALLDSLDYGPAKTEGSHLDQLIKVLCTSPAYATLRDFQAFIEPGGYPQSIGEVPRSQAGYYVVLSVIHLLR